MMKALVKTVRGPGGLELRDVEKPKIKPDEILLEVKVAAICGSDVERYTGKNLTYKPPVVLGHEISGIICEEGGDVTGFQVGDRVSVEANLYACGRCLSCKSGRENLCLSRVGIGYDVDGGFAKYVRVPANMLIPLPGNVSFEEGALMDVCVAVHVVMDRSKIEPGNVIVIIGPGFLGLCILQMCKLYKTKVVMIGLRKDAARLEVAKEFGADEILFFDETDIEKEILESTKQVGADIVFEVSGSQAGFNCALEISRRGGEIVMVGVLPERVEINLLKALLKEVTINGVRAYTWKNCKFAMELLSSGGINLKPLITGRFPLEGWEKAFNLLEKGEGIKILLIP